MEIKSRHTLLSEIKSTNQFEGWIKGSDLQASLPEMKKIQSAIYTKIIIWVLLCLAFAAFLYFIFTTTWFMKFVRENDLNKDSLFQPVFFGVLGITGLLLIYFTDKAQRKIRQVRTLNLLPTAFKELNADTLYNVFLSIKGKFYASTDKKDLDSWLAIYSGPSLGKLFVLTDQSFIKLNLGSKKSAEELVFSFAQVYEINKEEAIKFIQDLYALKKKSPHPGFPSTKLNENIFNKNRNKFRNFDENVLAEMMKLI